MRMRIQATLSQDPLSKDTALLQKYENTYERKDSDNDPLEFRGSRRLNTKAKPVNILESGPSHSLNESVNDDEGEEGEESDQY